MYRTILVPLDGSTSAEQAVPLAVAVAQSAQAKIHLVRVHRPAPHPDGHEYAKSVLRGEETYLQLAAAPVRDIGQVAVETSLLEGPVAQAVCQCADMIGANLMVLTTHGRGPFSRFWIGSVTDELLRRTHVPLLIHRPTKDSTLVFGKEIRFRKVVIALDGTEISEAVIGPAAEMARIMVADLLLLRVVEPIPVVAPDGMVYTPPTLEAELTDEMSAQARRYVDHVAARLQGEGLRVTTQVVVHESAATAILEAAAQADLVALSTHGRSAVARLFLGSVADKVVRGATCPVLIVRDSSLDHEGERS